MDKNFVKTLLEKGTHILVGNSVVPVNSTQAKIALATGTAQTKLPKRKNPTGTKTSEGRTPLPGKNIPFRYVDEVPKKGHEEIIQLYARAQAILTLHCRTNSGNQLKWKHWTHHLKERAVARKRLQSGWWKIPFNGQIPGPHQNQVKEIALVRIGGRAIDTDNYQAGLKSIVDQIKEEGWIKDDNPKWVKKHYHQITGGTPRLDILFF
jgi:hypothetical protein